MRLADRIPAGSRVLDVGCGTGTISAILREVCGAVVVGIEPDGERAQRARALGLAVINDYLSPEVLNGYDPFDFVVFADVLEHLPNPAHVVTLARQALKPRGSILVSVPNAVHFFVRCDIFRGVFQYQEAGIMDATHLRWFTRDSIKQFFERLNFEVIHENHTVMINLPDYSWRRPFRWFSPEVRSPLIRKLAAWNPRLFAVQHIVQARLPG